MGTKGHKGKDKHIQQKQPYVDKSLPVWFWTESVGMCWCSGGPFGVCFWISAYLNNRTILWKAICW
jgi:hypothetical protein